MAKMNIGGSWIDPEFHPQRPPEREFLLQFILADDLRSALPQDRERFIRLHDQLQNSAPGCGATCFCSATRAPARSLTVDSAC